MKLSDRQVVVIGAGMGGLASALRLATAGVRVTVLERHGSPGGKMREVIAGSAPLDSGPTVFTMRWVFEDLFAAAGTRLDEHVSLLRESLLARHSWTDGSRLDLFADLDQSVDAIEQFAGHREAHAYRRFAQQSASIFETLDASFMRAPKPSPVELALSLGLGGVPKLYATKPFTSLWQELGKVFTDPRLQQLFGRYATYCGSSPFSAPATLMLIAHAERAGVWLVDGGMQRLAEALTSLSIQRGATIEFNRHVDSLDIRRGRVHGVHVGDDYYEADAVVFNGDAAALASGQLGTAAKRAVPKRKQHSLSAITWSMQATTTGLDLAHHTVLFGDNYIDEFDHVFKHKAITHSPTVYLCAQDRGPGRTRQSPERLFALINAPACALSSADLDRYEQYMFAQLDRHGVALDIAACVRTTPNDFARLFPATEGALYGSPTHGWNGSFDRPGATCKVHGLFLAGGSVHPGPGIPMATLSGQQAAKAALDALRTGGLHRGL
ncbi:MAG: 1-hydroxycarotenoid 3,4-desaturase CrtD [Pseudomonadota bacterium]